jgi:hypothetical protein
VDIPSSPAVSIHVTLIARLMDAVFVAREGLNHHRTAATQIRVRSVSLAS